MDLLTSFFTAPILPATLLLLVMLCWSAMAMVGAADLDMPGGDLDLDLDLDVDLDADAAGGEITSNVGSSVGLLALRWLNIRDVPLVLWLGVFSLVWWMISALTWWTVDYRFFAQSGWLWTTLLVIRNVGFSLLVTKWITGPMTGWFVTEKISSHSLIGEECEISSLEADEKFGQAKYRTDGSPLLLNIRTDGAHLARGTRVWITHYDSKSRIYVVSPTGTDGAASRTGGVRGSIGSSSSSERKE